MSASLLRTFAERAVDASRPARSSAASSSLLGPLPPIDATPANPPLRERPMAERVDLEREMEELHEALGVKRGAALAEAMKPQLTVPMPFQAATIPRTPAAGFATAATQAAPTAPTSMPPPAAHAALPAIPTPTQAAQPPAEQLLALPAPEDINSLITLDVSSGQAVTLDHLGPVVVNSDGTLARITNWSQMSDQEQQVTKRRIAKRNIDRLKVFRDRGDLKEELVSALQTEGERSGATTE